MEDSTMAKRKEKRKRKPINYESYTQNEDGVREPPL
jgi:hypothetical protein